MQRHPYQELLEQIAEEEARLYGGRLQPPCSPEALERLRHRARTELGCNIPEDYASFLLQHDGFNWNGIVIYASETTPIVGYDDRFIEGVIEANLGYREVERMKAFLVLGASGMDLYTHDVRRGDYTMRDRVSLDVYETFSSFDDLFTAALSSRI